MSNECLSLGPEIRGLIFAELELNDIPYAVVDHGQAAVTVAEKVSLLEGNDRVSNALLESSIIGIHDVPNIQFVVSKTLTGMTRKPAQIPFLVTTFGGASISTKEKKAILESLGIENPSSNQAKAIVFGDHSGVDIRSLGMNSGFVGPFVRSQDLISHGVKSLVMIRSLFSEATLHESRFPIVDFALGLEQSLLFQYNHFFKILKGIDLGAEFLDSPDRVVVGFEP